ncbi:MAG: UvrD-helicase domain-containing protein [Aaplasma endosymbiont of Hyalomma asiaticum]
MYNTDLDNHYRIATDPSKEFVWISASAGTGKTRMLVHRVIRLLMSEQENILCLTFTNAAAHEIRERIFNITKEWLLLSDDKLAEILKTNYYQDVCPLLCRRARNLFFKLPRILKVQTVHSFCKSVISSFPIETGVASNFLVRDLSESYPSVFSQLLHNFSEVGIHLEQVACELKESTLFDLIYKIIRKRCDFHPVSEVTSSHLKLDSFHCPNEILHALENGGIRDKDICCKLRSWNNSKNRTHRDIEKYLQIFICIKSLEKKEISSIVSKKTLLSFPHIEKLIAREQERLLEFAEQYYTHRISKRTFHIMHVVNHCIALYNKDKNLHNFVSYDDIIRTTQQLLSSADYKDWVLFCLDSSINHILVDESQDNSLEQWSIIAQLCSEFFSGWSSNTNKRSLFVVGDVKQSIYGFQNARPDYFHLMRQYFTAKSEKAIIIQLSDSFRSTPPILYLVDKVFNTLREQVSFQSKEIKHHSQRVHDSGYVEVWPILSTEQRKKNNAWDVIDNSKELSCCNNTENNLLLAKTIANTICSWLEGRRLLAARNRPVEAGDILILVRQRSSFVDHMISELKRKNVAVADRDRFNIMEYLAIKDLVNLGEFLLLPDNDMALATLLKSPILQYTDDILLEMTKDNTETCSLWNRLQKFAPTKHVADYLSSLITMSRTGSPLDLYLFVLLQHKEKFILRFGTAAETVIEEFINLLIEYGSHNPNMLETFIHWIKNTNHVAKSEIGAHKNAVRIMTVHGAKGMQAPIVFLPDTTSVPKCDLQIVFDEQNAPLWCANDTNTPCKQLRAIKKQEEYNEYLRLLYVAMTRAEDELYIAGAGTANSKSWYKIISEACTESFKKKRSTLQPLFPDLTEVMYLDN